MKKYILLALIVIFGVVAHAQKSSKYKSDTLRVYGNCDMCEERIENACDVIGMKRADWNVETGMLTVLYNPSKIAVEEIHQLCADAGHATSKVKANEEAYDNLHHCCKYVIHDHDHDNDHDHENGKEKEHEDCSGKCGASCKEKK